MNALHTAFDALAILASEPPDDRSLSHETIAP
jgi:hypothetical protein